MTTLRVFSNRHIKTEVHNVQKGDWIYLDNALSRKRWSLFFRKNGIDEAELNLTYISAEEYFALTDIEFSALVGNPPYNDSNNGNIPIYPSFVAKATELADNVAMVIPSAWTISDERGGDVVRRIVGSPQTEVIKFLPSGTFENADVETLYFQWNRGTKNETRVVNNDQEYTITDYDYIWRDEKLKTILEKCGTAGSTKSWIVFNRMENSKKGNKEVDTVTAINKNSINITKTDTLDKYIGSYRVVTSFLPNSPGHIDVSHVIDPTISVKDGYTVSVCQNKTEAENLARLLKSNLAVFIFMKTRTSRTLRTPQLKFIPKVNLTRTWTDEELYEHFGLTQEEIDYIEQTVKK